MKQKFSKIFAGLDFDLLQDQKMTLVKIHDNMKDVNNSGTEKDYIDHLEGVINFLDRILDKAESDALWSFDEWAKKRDFDTTDREIVKD